MKLSEMKDEIYRTTKKDGGILTLDFCNKCLNEEMDRIMSENYACLDIDENEMLKEFVRKYVKSNPPQSKP